MTEQIELTSEQLRRIAPRETTDDSETWLAPFDVPESVQLDTSNEGQVACTFLYGDSEQEDAVTLLKGRGGIELAPGKYSGKVLAVRFSAPAGAVPGRLREAAAAIADAAPREKRKNAQLNFRLIASLLPQLAAQMETEAVSPETAESRRSNRPRPQEA